MNFRPFPDTPLSLSGLQDEFNRLLERVWHSGVSTGPLDGQAWAPVLDMCEHDDRFVLLFEVPGVDAREIEITLLGQALTIRGARQRPAITSDTERCVRSERRYGTFCRSIDLPQSADGDCMTASCSNGVLTITVQKQETHKPRTVEIKVAEAGD